MTTELEEFYNTSQAAELLGISRVTLWEWRKVGKIHTVNHGGFELVPRSEIDRVLRERGGDGTDK